MTNNSKDTLIAFQNIQEKIITLESWQDFISFRLGGVYRPTREFLTHMDTSPLPMKGWKFHLCSALMVIEQWEFFQVQHLLWHGPTLYNRQLRGPVTLTPVAERLAEELSLPVLRLRSVATGDRIPISRMWGERWYNKGVRSVSYTHLTLPTICSV